MKQTIVLPMSVGKRMGLREVGAARELSGGPSVSDEVEMAGGEIWVPGIAKLANNHRDEILHWARETGEEQERDYQAEQATPASPEKISQWVEEMRDRMAFRKRMEKQ